MRRVRLEEATQFVRLGFQAGPDSWIRMHPDEPGRLLDRQRRLTGLKAWLVRSHFASQSRQVGLVLHFVEYQGTLRVPL